MLAVCLELTKYDEQWHCCLNVLLTELLYSLTFDETRCHFVHIKCSLMPVLRDCFCCWCRHQLLLKTFSLPSSISLPMRIYRCWSLSICKWSLKPRVRVECLQLLIIYFLLKIFILNVIYLYLNTWKCYILDVLQDAARNSRTHLSDPFIFFFEATGTTKELFTALELHARSTL